MKNCTKFYTAKEIGKMLGISSTMVGRDAAKIGFKSKAGRKDPEGSANEYGRWVDTVTANGIPIMAFRYTEKGVEAIRQRRAEVERRKREENGR